MGSNLLCWSRESPFILASIQDFAFIILQLNLSWQVLWGILLSPPRLRWLDQNSLKNQPTDFIAYFFKAENFQHLL
jgi:hypothetical protein